MSAVTRPTRAIVVGAGMAGLLAARALADHADSVLLLERERLRDVPEPRAHVPQGRHGHVLLSSGEERMATWFPGLRDELTGLGAVRVDGTGASWYQAGGFRVRGDWGADAVSLTRPLLETTLRRRVRGLARVELRDGVRVDGVTVDRGRVTGVAVDGRTLPADLVVDCSGRSSRIAHDLESAAEHRPPVSRVTVDCAYGTRLLARGSADLDGTTAVVAPTPPVSWRGGTLLPVEGDRWILSLVGMHADPPPADDEGYAAFARSLRVPVLADVLARTEPLTPVVGYRFPSSQRRHHERVPRPLSGLVFVGDSACSFNPIYGQGMSVAALQVEVLAAAVARLGLDSPELPRRFHRRAARIIDTPWSIAVGLDFLHPRTTGPKPRGTDLLNRYVTKVIHATHVSLPVTRALSAVQNLQEPPSSLFRPRLMVTVLTEARRSPAEARRSPAEAGTGGGRHR
ncbi:MAG TPA: tryptophan 7-halogenase [Intrasporangium sp.]|uniref:NAD(P)/FAD-dependent oxidoreductase n=1 Tax=Intrasporangium sp. TaxID=1925024 RepID=UPI002D7853DB|nr:tryptophan 7-halogenase [Intrasporangium sp.]HET7398309.1 tryptophan 7-halogenase [Intrasporangium sp.]